MSNVKERILGAVTVMSEEDAKKVWELICATFILNNAEEEIPDPEELEAMNAYKMCIRDRSLTVSSTMYRSSLSFAACAVSTDTI